MTVFRLIRTSTLAALLAASLSPAVAGPAAEAFGACMSDSTTGRERKELARWMFAGMAAHPEIRSLSNVTPKDQEALSRFMGGLFTRLVTESCRAEARAVVEGEGSMGLQAAFGILGRMAMTELMSNKDVNAAMSDFERYADRDRVQGALSGR
ncbi:hypothetical protein [Ideonella sp.]|uniref:hypothetical protein n=1 Tax=Ideonella sp. TaxID=1929293 RepID=UPI0035B4E0FF